MENATKALIMAGGILIAILIIGSFMLFFGDLNEYEQTKSDAVVQEQVVKFNNSYTSYDRSNLTLNEIKSLYNKIQSNNERAANGDDNYYKITSNIKTLCLQPQNTDEQVDITTTKFKELDERLKNKKYSFKCEVIEYGNTDGRVSKMKFSMTDLITKMKYTSDDFE